MLEGSSSSSSSSSSTSSSSGSDVDAVSGSYGRPTTSVPDTYYPDPTCDIDYSRDIIDIAKGYDNLECTQTRDAIKNLLNKKKQKFEEISIRYTGDRGWVVSDSNPNEAISYNGYHVGILYNERVYCNVHPYGVPLVVWLNDFHGFGYCVVNPTKYQFLKVQ